MTCPSCGKRLVNLNVTSKPRSTFWCDECKIDIEVFDDNTLLIYDDKLLAEWVNDGEGICGDYNPSDPEDVNLLRFDISYNTNPPEAEEQNWEEVEDASYCTCVPADNSLTYLSKTLWIIFKEYREVIDDYISGHSVKKLGERLSWISGLAD